MQRRLRGCLGCSFRGRPDCVPQPRPDFLHLVTDSRPCLCLPHFQPEPHFAYSGPPEETEKAEAPLGWAAAERSLELPQPCLATERPEAPGSGPFFWGQHLAAPACLQEAGVMGLELWRGWWGKGLMEEGADGGRGWCRWGLAVSCLA